MTFQRWYDDMCARYSASYSSYEDLLEEAYNAGAAMKQAEVDRLMLEYCPDEMTPQQLQEWKQNQKPVHVTFQGGVCRMKHFYDGTTEWYDSNGNVTMRIGGEEHGSKE